MFYRLNGAKIYTDGCFRNADIVVRDGVISDILYSDGASGGEVSADKDSVFYNFKDCYIFPGFIDVHVHFREPGFSYKETVATGSRAAARGGYTSVCTMPNLNPVPDSVENIRVQKDIIEKDAVINVYPFASITVGEMGKELADIDALANEAIGFSDDGKGVQDADMMKAAMIKVKENGKIIAAHCEDNSLLRQGYIHDGEYAKINGHRGICSESEWGPIARDVELLKETGCKYHVCHVSAKESVEVIRKAKASGVDITCETGPHYLVFNDMQLQEDGRFKMNPPIRSEADRLALIEGIKDGTIDMIATDHAPHSAEEKSRGLEKSFMGVVGIETAFPVLYTHLVKTGVITLEKLCELLNTNASKRFGIGGEIKVGQPADFTVYDLNAEYEVAPKDFLSKGKSSPFTGMKVFGKCLMTACDGKIVWKA
ncbi:MAG: dihydroorotase [Clostridia bacterium]|nr:dihydroorotase [Clostridia bacterium]